MFVCIVWAGMGECLDHGLLKRIIAVTGLFSNSTSILYDYTLAMQAGYGKSEFWMRQYVRYVRISREKDGKKQLSTQNLPWQEIFQPSCAPRSKALCDFWYSRPVPFSILGEHPIVNQEWMGDNASDCGTGTQIVYIYTMEITDLIKCICIYMIDTCSKDYINNRRRDFHMFLSPSSTIHFQMGEARSIKGSSSKTCREAA